MSDKKSRNNFSFKQHGLAVDGYKMGRSKEVAKGNSSPLLLDESTDVGGLCQLFVSLLHKEQQDP